MLIQWTPQSARWFQTASAYTGFHNNLSRILLPYIPEQTTLCDLGCGTAMIDFALADRLSTVTCVDKSAAALRVVEDQIAASGKTNIETLCADVYALERVWDTALLVFFGQIGDNITHYLSLCRHNVVAVVRGGSRDNLMSGAVPQCRTVARTAAALDAQGVRWRLTESILEYGQPLESLEDAAAYVAAYRKNPPGQSVEEYLSLHLSATEDPRFPYYLPYQKHIGIFVISRGENLHVLSAPPALAR